MQKKIQRRIRKIKKNINQFFDRMLFVGKMTLVVFLIFFAVILMMTKPIRTNLESIFIEKDEPVQVSEILTENEFLAEIVPIALQAQTNYGVRPSVLVAQAALESDWGNSQLSKESNNYFGIKGVADGQQYATKEFTQDKWQNVQATFRTYPSLQASVSDYASLMKHGTSWNANLYQGVVSADHYRDAAFALQKAGYATDPDYANKLIRIIEQYDLQALDH